MGHRNPGAEQPPMIHPECGRWHCQGSRNENVSNADDEPTRAHYSKCSRPPQSYPSTCGGGPAGARCPCVGGETQLREFSSGSPSAGKAPRTGIVRLDQLKPRLTVPRRAHHAGRFPQSSIWGSPHFDVEP